MGNIKNPSADLKGMLDLVRASKSPLAPIFEAITNSLESIFELEPINDSFIKLSLTFNDTDPNAVRLDSIKVEDNGAGFNEKSYGRFLSLLDKTKGNHNRGTGRLQYFHRFGEILIDSVYRENNTLFKRSLKCSKEIFLNEEGDVTDSTGSEGTSLKLLKFEPLKGDDRFFENLTLEALVSKLKSKFALRAYLDSTRGKKFPKIIIEYHYLIADEVGEVLLDSNSFPKPSSEGHFEVPYFFPSLGGNSEILWNRSITNDPERFSWYVFEFSEDDIESHGAYLCSKDIAVQDIHNPLLPKNKGFNGIKKITAFCGDYLDKSSNVNDSVDSFDIKRRDDIRSSDLVGSLFDPDEYVYLDDIEDKAEELIKKIYEEVELAQTDRERRKFELARELGISESIANKVKVKVGDSDDIITVQLHKEEAQYIAKKANETRAIVKDLKSLDPTHSEYLQDLQEKVGEISKLIDDQNKEELSKYVVRRELVARLLDKILNKELEVQVMPLPKGKNRDREGIVHDLIFKRKKSTGSGHANDLWILNEEFVHFDGFSDLEISKMMLPDGTALLDGSDEARAEIEKFGFKPDKRPDVFLFAKEGKCILIEFKEPDTNLSHYLHQMPQYCKLLANYSNIKIQNFYCYLIGESIFPEADLDEYEESVTGDWYRDSIPVKRADTRERIASIRLEIIKLSDLAKRAHLRNRNFAEKLGLDMIMPEE